MKIHFIIERENDKAIEFWISDFPQAPVVGDLIDPEKMIKDEQIQNAVKDNVYRIESVTWNYSEGYYLMIFLNLA